MVVKIETTAFSDSRENDTADGDIDKTNRLEPTAIGDLTSGVGSH